MPNFSLILCRLVLILTFFFCIPTLKAEIEFVQFKWNAAICRDICIPTLAQRLESTPQIKNFQLDPLRGIANLQWDPKAEFSFGYINFVTRSAGVRQLEVRVQVRGVITRFGPDFFIVSTGDGTRFRLVGPLKTEPHRYTIQANIANHPLSPERIEKLSEAAENRELVTIEGPLFEPHQNFLTIIIEKLILPKNDEASLEKNRRNQRRRGTIESP